MSGKRLPSMLPALSAPPCRASSATRTSRRPQPISLPLMSSTTFIPILCSPIPTMSSPSIVTSMAAPSVSSLRPSPNMAVISQPTLSGSRILSLLSSKRNTSTSREYGTRNLRRGKNPVGPSFTTILHWDSLSTVWWPLIANPFIGPTSVCWASSLPTCH